MLILIWPPRRHRMLALGGDRCRREGVERGGVYLYVYIKSRDSFVCAEMKRSGHVIRGRLFVTGRGGMGVYTTRGGPVKATVPLQN